MKASLGQRARNVGDILLILGGVTFLLVYLIVALKRLLYPFELEWMEGGMVDHVRRVLAGQPVYAKPSLEFVSFLYPPLYYVAAAGFALVTGPGFLPLRALSLLSSLGVFALLFYLVRRETGAALFAVIAAGLFAATYQRAGQWFDLARLDSFYLLLLLGGVVVLRVTSSARGAGLAGLLFAAAFFTKQSALVILLPLAVFMLIADRRRAPWLLGVAGALMAAGTLILARVTHGWYVYYCYRLPSRHPMVPGGFAKFWTADLVPWLVPACLAGAAYVTLRATSRERGERFFYPLLAVGMIGSSWAVRAMVGAETNDSIPAFAALSILAPLGLHEMRRRAGAKRPRPYRVAAVLAQALLLVQLFALAYDPRRCLPTAADRAAGEQLVARIRGIPGDVFIPHHGYLARLAGKPGFAHTLAMDNVFLDDSGPVRDALGGELGGALESKRFSAVLLESDGRYGGPILASYPRTERLFANPDVFWPVTGARLRPEFLCLPR